jgi:hypothetical protein
MHISKQLISFRLIEKIIPRENGCWEWTDYKDKDGYGNIRIDGKNKKAHRVSYETFVGYIPEGMCICHTCDNPPCINPSHLFIGTFDDNNKDRDKKGRGIHGEKVHTAKLTLEEVNEIKVSKANGDSYRKLAKKFNVSPGNIWYIVKGKSWRSN